MPWVFREGFFSRLALVTGDLLDNVNAQPGQRVSFSKDIAPLLTQRCMECHGREPLMANLDLRTRDGALKGAKHGPVIVPGDAAASHLYRRLIGQETPPMPLGGRLTDAEIATHQRLDQQRRRVGRGPCAGSGRGHQHLHREEIHRAAAPILGIPKSREARRARRKGQGVGAKSDRRIYRCEAGREEAETQSARRPRDPDSPRDSRPHRPAADTRRRAGLRVR